jgi:Spy/CpxP family protein refolding chaperone
MKKTVVLLALVALLGSASLAIARGGMGCGMGPGMGPGMGGDMGCGMGPMVLRGLDQLNLSAEQWGKVQALKGAHMKAVTPIQNQLFAKRNEIRLLWAEPNPDGAQILAKQKELGGLQGQMREKATQFALDVRKVLTPEQLAKFSVLGPGMGGHQGFCPFQGGGPGPGPGGPGMGPGPGPGPGMGPGPGPGPKAN